MPTNCRFGLDDYQRVQPARPNSSRNRPEEPIERPQGRSRPLPLHHRELLAERDDFGGNLSACLEEDTNRGKHGNENGSDGIIAILTRPRPAIRRRRAMLRC